MHYCAMPGTCGKIFSILSPVLPKVRILLVIYGRFLLNSRGVSLWRRGDEMTDTERSIPGAGPAARSTWQKGLPLALLTLLCMTLFALNSILCRLALLHHGMDPVSYTAIRMTSGALMLFVLHRWRQRRHGQVPDWRGQGSWGAALALFTYMLAFSVAYVSMPTAAGALVIAVAVQTSMIGYGIHAGQRPNLGQTLGIGLAMAGLVVLLLPGLEAPPLPAACVMFVSGSAWGAYSLCGRKFRHAAEATTDNFIRCVPLVLVLMLALWWRLSLPLQGVVLALCAGALASALGYILWYALVPCYSIAAAAAAQLSVPVITALGAVVFVGEAITLRLVLCSAAILGGIFIVALWGQRHAVPRADGNRCGQSADTASRR